MFSWTLPFLFTSLSFSQAAGDPRSGLCAPPPKSASLHLFLAALASPALVGAVLMTLGTRAAFRIRRAVAAASAQGKRGNSSSTSGLVWMAARLSGLAAAFLLPTAIAIAVALSEREDSTDLVIIK